MENSNNNKNIDINIFIDELALKVNGSEYLAQLELVSLPYSIKDILDKICSKYKLTELLDKKEFALLQQYGIYLFLDDMTSKYRLIIKDRGAIYIEEFFNDITEAFKGKIKLWAYSSSVKLNNSN